MFSAQQIQSERTANPGLQANLSLRAGNNRQYLRHPRSDSLPPRGGGLGRGGWYRLCTLVTQRPDTLRIDPASTPISYRTIPPTLTLPHKGGGDPCGAWDGDRDLSRTLMSNNLDRHES